MIDCDDEVLRAELVTRVGEEARVAVNVLRAPEPFAGPFLDEDVARLDALVDGRLLRIARRMRAQARTHALIVNVVERGARPDGIARAVDEGVAALGEVVGQQHRVPVLCIVHAAGSPSTIARVIAQRWSTRDVPWSAAPVVLGGE